ncbi:MAG TPA: efflux RND transporter periplasmic adaptor subunit [Bacteroidales bacterium]|nr:efflux RND transporter periplasmic adaptor subunit [Bacteroidales bacterium]HQI71139.1 efflux RND transporter periplasmic adaptor subunit [Bacteroidales bacterium]
MTKIKWLTVILSGILLLGSCKNGEENKKKESAPVPVDILIAREDSFPRTVEVNGTVLSEDMIELRPEVSGRLTYLNIPDGGSVAKGAILAKINDAELQAQLKQYEVQLELATKTEERLKKLLSINGVNQADYDDALSKKDLYKANIEVLKTQIDKTIIKAPFNGKLGLRQVSAGAYVTPQTLIGTLQQTDKIKIDFSIPEAYETLISTKKTITVKSNNSEEEHQAIISAIEPQISTTTRNIKVRAHLVEGILIPGAFVKVYLRETTKGIVVPTSIIIPEAYSNQVVTIKNGKAKFVNVEVGARTAEYAEITNGLLPGDSVVVSGVLFVRPNAKVKIKQVKKSLDTHN